MPRWVRHTRQRFMNRASTRGSQRILANFGQFIREQFDTQLNYDLHRTPALTLMQPLVQNHEVSV
jgi:hypothetical protein